MHLEALFQKLASLNINPDKIETEQYAMAFKILFTIVEQQNEKIENLSSENQMLRDENNLLKGEQTKPNIRGSKKNDDISAESERNQRKPQKNRKSNTRIDKIEIHQTETCKVDKSTLPEDAVFKGYRSVVIRDIIMKYLNTKYKTELFYSLSEGKTYRGKLPDSVKGEFGAGLISHVINLYHVANTS